MSDDLYKNRPMKPLSKEEKQRVSELVKIAKEAPGDEGIREIAEMMVIMSRFFK